MPHRALWSSAITSALVLGGNPAIASFQPVDPGIISTNGGLGGSSDIGRIGTTGQIETGRIAIPSAGSVGIEDIFRQPQDIFNTTWGNGGWG
ncbi:MAG: hypothetical protein ABG776_00615, partial [Cyanobacteria bacterium J06555_13]